MRAEGEAINVGSRDRCCEKIVQRVVVRKERASSGGAHCENQRREREKPNASKMASILARIAIERQSTPKDDHAFETLLERAGAATWHARGGHSKKSNESN
jgi:hypothetical protein